MKVMETITASVNLRRRGDSGTAGARGWSGSLAGEGLFFTRADFIVDYRGENLATPGNFVHRFFAYINVKNLSVLGIGIRGNIGDTQLNARHYQIEDPPVKGAMVLDAYVHRVQLENCE
jgi:hypothetical protein